jgi:hypothetical protein
MTQEQKKGPKMTKASSICTSLLHRLGAGRRVRLDAFGGTGASKISRGSDVSFTEATRVFTSVRLALFSLPATLLVSLLATLAFSTAPALATGDASQSTACANEALSGFSPLLAECRAWEQVTPSFKAGTAVQSFEIAADGSRVLGQTLGAFADTHSDHTTEGAFYLFSRSGSGWAPSAVSPVDAAFPAAVFKAASTGLERTLWFARSPSQSVADEDLYVREANGAMVEVGPLLPPSATEGPPAGEYSNFRYHQFVDFDSASDDLSHVVFSLLTKAPLWPGDTTNIEGAGVSLYEYRSVGLGAPELVGVSDGSTSRGGKALPAGVLISDCETDLGSEKLEDMYNAVSADGGTVFFTAMGHNNTTICAGGEAPAVSELFARVGGFRTVAISEPTTGQCGACETSVRAPAQFAGASESGLQAFFLTSQELFSEAKGMNLYEYDFDAPNGKKVIRVSAGVEEPKVQGVTRVSEDGSHVYFVAKGVLTGANGEGAEPLAGGDNLYVYERDEAFPTGRLAFVATLSPADAADWSATDIRPVQATGDGGFLVFQSAADLTAGDSAPEGDPQLFEYDAEREELARVSVGGENYSAGEVSALEHPALIKPQTFSFQGVSGVSPASKDSDLAVSGDGATVVFTSVGALTKGALTAAGAGAQSVYEYHSSVATGGGIAGGVVHLVSDGVDTAEISQGVLGAFADGIDSSGEDIFFETADPLVSGDGDTQYDVYDARVDGGFEQEPASVECQGEACQGLPLVQPIFTPPSSASVAGNSNLTPPPPSKLEPPAEGTKGSTPKPVKCKKGFTKKKGKCVKNKKTKKAKKSAKRASHNGRGK